ncbi:ribosomal protein L28e [Baffinella frigidus]|nr:ribosomal protein L28e [Cryptophyta sp. CCMP2293]
MSGNCSPDLLWMLVRKNNAFMVKKDMGRIQFSKEPYNLTNQNSFKFSGLCNSKAADIQGAENGVVLGIKSQKGKNSPAKLYKTTKCARDFTRDFRRVAKCIKNTVGGYYRPDLSRAALTRWTKFHRSLKITAAKKGVAKK